MKNYFKMDKYELDYKLISLSKEKEGYNQLIYYDKVHNNDISKIINDIDSKLSRLIRLYALL